MDFYFGGKYIGDADPAELVSYHQKKGRRVVEASGSFNPPHLGHLEFLNRVNNLADITMINLNNDEWLKRRKKKDRVLYTLEETAKFISWQVMVDYVFVHPGYEIPPAISLALHSRPDIMVLRADAEPELLERAKELLNSIPGYSPNIRLVPRSDVEMSSSEIMERVEGKKHKLSYRDLLEVFIPFKSDRD